MCVCSISYFKKSSASFCHKCTNVFMYSTRYSCQILMKVEFSRQIFEKYTPNFMKICPVGSQFHSDGRTVHIAKLTVAFHNFAPAPNKHPTTFRGELSYLAPLGSENISAPYFKRVSFGGGGITPQTESNTTPPSPKTEITNILFYISNFASIIKFKM